MNRLAGETACPTHRQVVWLQCGAGSVACLPRCSTDSFTPSQSPGGPRGISFSLSRAVVENGPDKLKLIPQTEKV